MFIILLLRWQIIKSQLQLIRYFEITVAKQRKESYTLKIPTKLDLKERKCKLMKKGSGGTGYVAVEEAFMKESEFKAYSS